MTMKEAMKAYLEREEAIREAQRQAQYEEAVAYVAQYTEEEWEAMIAASKLDHE